ncbi:uncharacterized protein LOC126751598 [Bactrocera neohumeralis]|uniref:uncharacterized protein LOC126751598 n=1 Tax=Bactrocera neohumeralis TaxID=98809 RepID=UPI0021662B26|nr:uncharacterized protein LOC126751598 [Bactrocera neohumeralis]
MAAQFKSRTNSELSVKTYITVKNFPSEKMLKEDPNRLSKQKRAPRQVHIKESSSHSFKSAVFDEENILSTQSSNKSQTINEITSLATPYTKPVNMNSKLMEINARRSSEASFVLETSTPTNVSSYNVSSPAFLLKRQQFSKGEYTNAKCGRYARIHPPLCSIPAERLVCVPGSLESLTDYLQSPQITVYP